VVLYGRPVCHSRESGNPLIRFEFYKSAIENGNRNPRFSNWAGQINTASVVRVQQGKAITETVLADCLSMWSNAFNPASDVSSVCGTVIRKG
jgi:hypothetical protein